MGNILKSLGKVARVAAPFIPGVGTIGSLAIGAAGSALARGGRRRRRQPVVSDADRTRQYYDEAMEMTGDSVRARTSAMMPEFERALQGIRETNQRRGIANGDLATSYEGDAASAFQRNIANAIAEQSDSAYNTALDRLYGEKDRRIAARNARRDRRSNTFGALAGAIGSGVGAYYGRKGVS